MEKCGKIWTILSSYTFSGNETPPLSLFLKMLENFSSLAFGKLWWAQRHHDSKIYYYKSNQNFGGSQDYDNNHFFYAKCHEIGF